MTTASSPTGSGGKPLVALGGLLLCWIAVRAVFFEMPIAALPEVVRAPARFVGLVSTSGTRPETLGIARIRFPVRHAGVGEGAVSRVLLPLVSFARGAPPALPSLLPVPSRPVAAPLPPRLAAGHNLLWMAAMQGLPLPAELASAIDGRSEAGGAPYAPREAPRRRWSGDVWTVLREGGASLGAAGAIAPVYGASQAGAVLRYDLAPGSRLRPAAYVRAVHALGGTREADLAAGLVARPFARVPLTAHIEARTSRRGGEVEVRPAAFAAGGFDEVPLPFGVRARGYAQAGYVGGRDATAFADGSVVGERAVFSAGATSLGVGAGLWGGAQRGAARVDLGPSASLRFRLGEGSGRVAVDYRLRVAGNAEPAAGAALTLSAGF
jgi:hypothetical protein